MHEKKQSPVTRSTDPEPPPAANQPANPSRIPVEQDRRRYNETTAIPQLARRMNRWGLIGLLIVAGVLFFILIRIFLVPLIVAATFVALMYPVYRLFLRLFGNNKALASLTCCLMLTLCVLIPVFLVLRMMTLQAIEFAGSSGPLVRAIGLKVENLFHTLPYLQSIQNVGFDWQAALPDAVKSLTSASMGIVNRVSSGLLQLVVTLVVVVFVMFYLFMDGEAFVKKLRFLSPLRSEYEDTIVTRFLLISRAAIKGTLLIALIQGALGAITLLVFGIHSWLMWGVAMIVMAIIPLAGSWTILLPAGLVQIALGNTWQGIGIIACSLLVISQIDNVIRPRLVGQEAKVHDLIVFFSSVGGIVVFGPLGFIVGPVIASFFLAVMEIYGKEFEGQLSSSSIP